MEEQKNKDLTNEGENTQQNTAPKEGNGKKKKFKVLRIIGVILALSFVIYFAGNMLFSWDFSSLFDSDLGGYPTTEEITTTGTQLGVDLGGLSRIEKKGTMSVSYKYTHLVHNNNEPICVTFDGCSQSFVQTATQTLDYLFGIVGQFNEKYRYQVVDKSEVMGKSYIEYRVGGNAAVSVSHGGGRYYRENSISYNEQKYDKLSSSQQYNELLRALCKVFRLNGDEERSNTFMNPAIGDKYGQLLPNDLRCLASLVTPAEMQTTTEKLVYYDRCNDVIQPRVQQYLTYFVSGITDNLPIEEEDYKILISHPYILPQGEKWYCYAVIIDNNRYKMGMYDSDTLRLLERCTGNVSRYNGILILENLMWKHPFTNEEMKEEKSSYTIAIIQTAPDVYSIYVPSVGLLACQTDIKNGEKDRFALFEFNVDGYYYD